MGYLDLKGTPRDGDGHVLIGHGTEIYTKRFTSVGTGGTALTISGVDDWKGGIIHYEGANIIGYYAGNVSGSDDIYLTLDGVTVEIPMAGVSGDSLGTAKAPSGTINVSVLLWR